MDRQDGQDKKKTRKGKGMPDVLRLFAAHFAETSESLKLNRRRMLHLACMLGHSSGCAGSESQNLESVIQLFLQPANLA